MFRTSHFSLTSNHLKAPSSTDSEPSILFEYQKHVCKTTLNKPKTLNSFTEAMYDCIAEEARKWNKDPELRVVMFEGNGIAFCSGLDLKELYIRSKGSKNGLPVSLFKSMCTVNVMVAGMKPIQVALWNGIVMGSGVGISVHAPIRIATENCVFAMPEAKIGFFTNVGGGYFLSRAKNYIGYFLGLTGYALRGQEVVQTGFADFFVESGQLEALKEDILKNTNANTQVEDVRKIVQKYAEPVSDKYRYEDFIKEAFNKGSAEEIYNGLKQNTKNKQFAEKIVATMDTYSPLSLDVIYEQINVGKEMSLLENFLVEARVTDRFGKGKDFYEGIRCTLIDRDDTPKWEYKTFKDVPRKEVDRYFDILPDEQERMEEIVRSL